MDDKYKFSGWAMTLLASVQIITFLFIFIYFDIPLSTFTELTLLEISYLLFALIMLVLLFYCGIELIKQNDKIHHLALVVSLIILFAPPVGTIVGGCYLLERRQNLKMSKLVK